MAKSKIGTEDLLEQFKEMTLLELSEFIKAVRGGVRRQGRGSRPDDDGRWSGRGRGRRGGREEQSEFDVILLAAGDKKIQAIKEVRALTSLGLKEAKDLVDGAPQPVLEKVTKEAADKAKEQLEAVGATAEIK